MPEVQGQRTEIQRSTNGITETTQNWFQRGLKKVNNFFINVGIKMGGQFGANAAAAALGTGIVISAPKLIEELKDPKNSFEKNINNITNTSRQWLENNTNQLGQLTNNASSFAGDIFKKIANTFSNSVDYVKSLLTGPNNLLDQVGQTAQQLFQNVATAAQPVVPYLPVISAGLVTGALMLRGRKPVQPPKNK